MILDKLNPDTTTTTTGTVTAISSVGAVLSAIMPQMGLDPSLAALLPPPYNLYVMLGLIGIAALSHIIQSAMTNKKTVNVTSDSQMTIPPPAK